MPEVVIDGRSVRSEVDLHSALEEPLAFGPYYGRNLAALRDRLLTDVERPVRIVWVHSAESEAAMGSALFSQIVDLFADAEEQDRVLGWSDRFEFELR